MMNSQMSPNYNRFNRRTDYYGETDPYENRADLKNLEHINPSLKYHNDPQPFTNLQMENQERGFITGEQKELGRQCIYICPLIFFIITLFLSITAVIYNAKTDYKGSVDAQDALKYFAHNLQRQIFESATAVPISQACPKDFYVEKLGTFYRIKSGCICEDGSTHNKAYCYVKGKSKNCKYFNGAGSRDFQFWKSHKICVKKFKSYKFVHAKTDCKKFEMKKCQAHVCVNGNTCPVTSVKITKVDEKHVLVKTPTRTQFSFTKGFVFEEIKDNKEDPLVNLDSEFDSFPCVSHNLNRPQKESLKTYPLNSVPQKGCGEYGNIASFAEKVDSIGYKQYYVENGLEFVYKSAPFYSSYVSDIDFVKLFGVRRIPIKNSPECVDIDPGQIHSLVYGLYKLNGCIYAFGIIIIILSTIGLILTLLFLTMRNRIKFLNSKKGILTIYILALIVIFFSIVLFLCFIHYFYHGEVEHARVHFDTMIRHKCFEVKTFEKAANETNTLVHKVSRNINWIIFTLFFFCIGWFLVYHIIMAVRKKKRLDAIPNPAIL